MHFFVSTTSLQEKTTETSAPVKGIAIYALCMNCWVNAVLF